VCCHQWSVIVLIFIIDGAITIPVLQASPAHLKKKTIAETTTSCCLIVIALYKYKCWGGVHIHHHGLWRTGQGTDREATQKMSTWAWTLDSWEASRTAQKFSTCGWYWRSCKQSFMRKNCYCLVLTSVTVSSQNTPAGPNVNCVRKVECRCPSNAISCHGYITPRLSRPRQQIWHVRLWTTECVTSMTNWRRFITYRILHPGGVVCLMDWLKSKGLTE